MHLVELGVLERVPDDEDSGYGGESQGNSQDRREA
jgi:hypothetical protein